MVSYIEGPNRNQRRLSLQSQRSWWHQWMTTAFLLESQERSKALSFCSSNDESCVAPSKEIVPGLTTRVLDWLGYKAACTVFQYDFSEIKSCGCRIDSDLDAFSILFRLVYIEYIYTCIYIYIIFIYICIYIYIMHTYVSVMIKPGSPPQHHCAAPLRRVQRWIQQLLEWKRWRLSGVEIERRLGEPERINWSITGPFSEMGVGFMMDKCG